jgi:protein-disulfide isomerase
MKRFFRYAQWLALPAALLLPLGAAEPGITRKQADQILDELKQIRQLLEKQTAALPGAQPPQITKANIGIDGAFTLGSKDAPLTMVEFTDFQCPYCKSFHVSTFSELKKNYIDTGKLRFVSRDLPLDFHPNAMQAANAGRCAGEQGQFWAMRDRMNSNPEKLDIMSLLAFAGDLKLDVNAFRTCVESGKYKNKIQDDIALAERIGANGTPAFVIGKTTADGVDGEVVVGALPYAMFEQKLKELAR